MRFPSLPVSIPQSLGGSALDLNHKLARDLTWNAGACQTCSSKSLPSTSSPAVPVLVLAFGSASSSDHPSVSEGDRLCETVLCDQVVFFLVHAPVACEEKECVLVSQLQRMCCNSKEEVLLFVLSILSALLFLSVLFSPFSLSAPSLPMPPQSPCPSAQNQTFFSR